MTISPLFIELIQGEKKRVVTTKNKSFNPSRRGTVYPAKEKKKVYENIEQIVAEENIRKEDVFLYFVQKKDDTWIRTSEAYPIIRKGKVIDWGFTF